MNNSEHMELDDLSDANQKEAETYLALWDTAAENAAFILRQALDGSYPLEYFSEPPAALADAALALRSGFTGKDAPYDLIMQTNDWSPHELPQNDEILVLWSGAALMIMEEDPSLSSEEQSALLSLEFGDWLGAVIESIREGVGTSLHPDLLVDRIERCPEIDGGVSPQDRPLLEKAFCLMLPLWHAASIIDDNNALTDLGVWALPRMLFLTWDKSFDNPSQSAK